VREELTARAVGEIERLAPTARHAGLSVVDERGALELTSLPGGRRGGGWVAVQAPRALGRTERMLLNQAISLLTLQLVRPRELAEAHRRLGATVLDLLLDPATVSTEVASHVRHVGLSALEALRVVVVACEPRLPDRVLAGLDGLGVPHLVTTRDSEAVVATRSDAADAVVDHLQAALADAAITDAWVGVSGVVTADRLAEALQSARQAARSARWARRRVARHDTLSLATVLADEPVRERVNTLAHSVLASLDEGDARSRTLRDSLEVFLRANGSWETAARNLGVHRHTLRNRMTRVEELTGLSLDVAENRVVLLLALLADDRG
jgi:purine catabolism regulator